MPEVDTPRPALDAAALGSKCKLYAGFAVTQDPGLSFEDVDALLDVISCAVLQHNAVEIQVPLARAARNSYRQWCDVCNDPKSDPDLIAQAPRGMGLDMGKWWVLFGAPLEVPLQRVLPLPEVLFRDPKAALDFVNAVTEQIRVFHPRQGPASLLDTEQLILNFQRDFALCRQRLLRGAAARSAAPEGQAGSGSLEVRAEQRDELDP